MDNRNKSLSPLLLFPRAKVMDGSLDCVPSPLCSFSLLSRCDLSLFFFISFFFDLGEARKEAPRNDLSGKRSPSLNTTNTFLTFVPLGGRKIAFPSPLSPFPFSFLSFLFPTYRSLSPSSFLPFLLSSYSFSSTTLLSLLPFPIPFLLLATSHPLPLFLPPIPSSRITKGTKWSALIGGSLIIP